MEQSDQPVLFLTSERSFGWDICDLRRGVNKLDLCHRVKVDPVKQPTKRNSVCAGNVSHRPTSAFHHHLGHRIVVFKDEQHCFVTGKLFVGRDKSQSPLLTALPTFVILWLHLTWQRISQCWNVLQRISPCFRVQHIKYQVPQIQTFQSETRVA